MTSILAFIILLGVLVTIHEYGHFMAARSVGVRVDRFSIGMPPRFITVESVKNGFLVKIFFFKRKEGVFKWLPIIEKHIKKPGRLGSGTEYVIALMPLGGYVKLAGMIDENMDPQVQYEKDEFMSQPLWGKVWILSAGVIMNTILAFIIFASLGYYNGKADIKNEPIVSKTMPDYPANLSGIISGDRIIAIDDYPINTWDELTDIVKIKPNTEMTISIKRNGEVQKKVITSTTSVVAANGGLDTIGAIGVYPEMIYSEMSLQEALLTGLLRTVGSFTMIIESLRMIGSGQASVKDLGGPIMIAQLAGQTAEAGFIPFLTFMALLSVNLAFLNILPIPGLDGGHIFIHCIESLIRKPLTLKTRIIIQQLGMAFLLVLMVTIIFQDITRLFN